VSVSLTGPVNSQGAQWGCRYIPINVKGDQLDCTDSGDEPGVHWDCVVCVCVYEGCRCPQPWVRARATIITLVTASHCDDSGIPENMSQRGGKDAHTP